MQIVGNGVGLVVELIVGVQHGEDDFDGRFFLGGVYVGGYVLVVVGDTDVVVGE